MSRQREYEHEMEGGLSSSVVTAPLAAEVHNSEAEIQHGTSRNGSSPIGTIDASLRMHDPDMRT